MCGGHAERELQQRRNMPPRWGRDFVGSGSTKIPLLTELQNWTHSKIFRVPFDTFAVQFIFSGVKPALHKTKKHPISKYVGC